MIIKVIHQQTPYCHCFIQGSLVGLYDTLRSPSVLAMSFRDQLDCDLPAASSYLFQSFSINLSARGCSPQKEKQFVF